MSTRQPCKDLAYGPVTLHVKRELKGKRLDRFLHDRFPRFSRSRLQDLIRLGAVTVNGKPVKPSYQVARGDEIRVELPEDDRRRIVSEPIPLDIIYEDDHLLVVNKPAGMVVHPARGNWQGTLVNALLHHTSALSSADPSRPGIVHRLDQFTSGVIVCAKTDEAACKLGQQFEYRGMKKEYVAITEGEPELDSGRIDLPLGPHPRNREKMAVKLIGGKRSLTDYRVEARLAGFCFIRLFPRTGRTHQLRVHLLSMGCPVLCDALYSTRSRLFPQDLGLPGGDAILERQALHAARLMLKHPAAGKEMEFDAPLPADMEAALRALRDTACRRKTRQ